MKRVLLLVLLITLLSFQQGYSQRNTWVEDFDGGTVSFIPTPLSSGSWTFNSVHTLSGSKSYWGQIPSLSGDTAVVTVSSIAQLPFDFTNYSNVQLRFSHICKVSPSDITQIQYKLGGSSTWVTIPATTYRGSGTYSENTGFNAASYAVWGGYDSTRIPTSSWWREEIFNLNGEVDGMSGVEFRFVIKHGSVLASEAAYGWLLENFEIIASSHPISTPIVELVSPFVRDTVYSVGSWNINAKVKTTSSSPIEQPWLKWTAIIPGVSQPVLDSIPMTDVSGDSLWVGTIPQYIAGTQVYYSITGRDIGGNESTIGSKYYIKLSCGGIGMNPADFSYTGNDQMMLLPPGEYEIECWGAEGGVDSRTPAHVTGKGGYTKGKIVLSANTMLYIYVGQKGANGSGNLPSSPSWNGGGAGAVSTSVSFTSGAGGGASDVRLAGGKWDDVASLNSRIMVAGGGGGTGCLSGGSVTGGNAGGLTGFADLSGSYTTASGNGGTQIAGGTTTISGVTLTNPGTLGKGGNGMATAYSAAGGGGGFYGGGGGQANYGSGGGGSSYISGYMGCVNHSSGLTFTNSAMIAGNATMLSPVGINEIGHLGDGFVRITPLQIFAPCFDHSVAIYSIDMQDTITVSPGVNTPIVATVKNTGTTDLSSVTVSYAVNGTFVKDTIINFNPPLPWDFNKQITIGEGYLQTPNNTDSITVWVSMPNGHYDTTTYDDTIGKNIYGSTDIVAQFIDGPIDTVYSTGPYEVIVEAISISGSPAQSVLLYLEYIEHEISSAIKYDTITMIQDGDFWTGVIPNIRYISDVAYRVEILDNLNNLIPFSRHYFIARPDCGEETSGGTGDTPGVPGIPVDYQYTGSEQQVQLAKGTYEIECWGARGAIHASSGTTLFSNFGAPGGYSKGIYTVNSPTVAYIYVGGNANHYIGGWNGGGSAVSYATGGGGASDVRVGGMNLTDRIIVAGGSGGTRQPVSGGVGGGLTGGTGDPNSPATGGTGGTQIAGGANGTPLMNGVDATLGMGASGTQQGSCGGGGGYYGGGRGGYASSTAGGGGGSGYIGGVTSGITVDSTQVGFVVNPDNVSGHGYVRITTISIGGTGDCLDNSVAMNAILSPGERGDAGMFTPVKVRIRNRGVSDLDSCYLNWSLNGTLQTPTFVYRNLSGLPEDFTDTITIGYYTAAMGGTDNIVAWVSLPNGEVDSIAYDDTLKVASLGCSPAMSLLTVGTGGDYSTITMALQALQDCGMSGDVTISMLPGSYPGQDILYNTTTYGNHKLTITSSTGIASDVTFTSTLRLNNANNIILKDITVDVSSLSVSGVELAGICTDIEINGCTILANPTATASTSRGIAYVSSSASANYISNISIINNTIDGGYYNIYLNYMAGSNNSLSRNNRIDNNTLTNAYYYGIYTGYYGYLTSVSNNTITTRAASSIQYAMYFYYYMCVDTVVNNKILLRTTGTSASYGIYLNYYTNITTYGATQPAFVANNEIRHFTGGGTIYGISTYYARADIFHNSVYLQGTAAAYGMYLNTTSSSYYNNIKNNIFSVSTTAATGYPIYTATAAYATQAYNTFLDYNDYYSTGANVGYIASARATMAALQTGTGQDANSVSVLPSFINVNSHLNLLQDAGITCPRIVPVIDIVGTPRLNTTTMGCYAMLPMNGNGVLSEITGLTDGANAGQTENVNVVVYNTGSTPLTSINLEWSINGQTQGAANYPVSLQLGDFTTVTLGTITYPANSVDIKVWINNLNNNTLVDESSTDDTLSTYINVCISPYNGTITVGAGGIFPNITSAINALNLCGVSGDITLALMPGTYMGNLDLSNNSTLFGNNKLTITSFSSNVDDAVLGSTIILNNSKNIVIKGITVDVSSATIPAIQFTGTCTNIVIRDCKLLGNPTTTTSATTNAPISKVSGTGVVDSIFFINNLIDGGYYGWYFYGGTGTAAYGTNVVFDSNTVSNQYYYGTYPYYVNCNSYSYNKVLSRDSNSSVTWYAFRAYYTNGPIIGNRIIQRDAAIASPYGMYIYYHNYYPTASVRGRDIVANNEVIVRTSGEYHGLYLYYAKSEIINNSIYVAGSGAGRGIYISNSTANNLVIKNNNIVMASSLAHPIYFSATGNLNLYDIDYNNMYASQYVGYYGANITTIPAWQAQITSDKNSVSWEPTFVNNANNLNLDSLSQLNANARCPMVSGTLLDINGSVRMSNTTKGAYERPYPDGYYDFLAEQILQTNVEVVNKQVIPVDISVWNIGSVADSITLGWSINGTPQQPVTHVFSTPLLQLERANIPVALFTVNGNVGDTLDIVVWIDSINGTPDTILWNNTVSARYIILPLAEFTTPLVKGTIGSLSFTVSATIFERSGATINTPEMYIETIMDGVCSIHAYDTIPMIYTNGKWEASIPKQYYGSKVIYTLDVSDTINNNVVLIDSIYIKFDGIGGIAPTTDYSYTGNVQMVTLPTGTYELECWGANGEAASTGIGGIGGYSKGNITITAPTPVYIFVGGKGLVGPSTYAIAAGGWNGGGDGYGSTVTGAGGGGATHIATLNGQLTDVSARNATFIVAGGGGGAGYNGNGGNGGGLSGANGNSGTGGTQTGTNMGNGANVPTTGSTGGGGGGGWYGGNMGSPGNTGGAGGGSGYIGGVTNGVTAQVTESGFIANPDLSGNGYIRITIVSGGTGDVYDNSNNLAIYNLASPVSSGTSSCSPDYAPVEIELVNLGKDDYDFANDSIIVGYEVRDPQGRTYSGSVNINTDSLLSGEVMIVELIPSFPLLAGRSEIKAWVISAIDDFVCDDTLTTIYVSDKVGLPINEDFSNGMPIPFISNICKDDNGKTMGTTKWEAVNSVSGDAVQPNFGTGLLQFEGSIGTMSFISTRQLDLYQASNPFMEFWYYHDSTLNDYSYTTIYVVEDEVAKTAVETIIKKDGNKHGWTHYRIDLTPFTLGNHCIFIQFESMSKYNGVAQYIDRIHITSDLDLAISEILITPQLDVCNMKNKDVYVVIQTTTSQSINFEENKTKLELDIMGTKYQYPLDSGILEGNTPDTLLIESGVVIPVGTYTIKAYFTQAVDNNPINDIAEYDIDFNPQFNAELAASTEAASLKGCFSIGTLVEQRIQITNTGTVELSNIVMLLEINEPSATPPYHFMMIDTLIGTIPVGGTETYTFREKYTAPAIDIYSVNVTAYLECDSAMANTTTYIVECVDMDDLYIVDIIHPTGTAVDQVGDTIKPIVSIGNHCFKDFEDIEITALIVDLDGTEKGRIEGIIPQINMVDTLEYTFTEGYIVPELTNYKIIVFFKSVDEYLSNDTMFTLRTTNYVGIKNMDKLTISMEQNIPNPASGNTIIRYSIPKDGEVSFKIYSVSGQILYNNVENVQSGDHQIEINTANFAAGIYFYTMEFEGQRITRRMSKQ